MKITKKVKGLKKDKVYLVLRKNKELVGVAGVQATINQMLKKGYKKEMTTQVADFFTQMSFYLM